MRMAFALLLLAASVAYLFYGLETLAFLNRRGRPGAGFFPILVGIALVACCALAVLRDLRLHLRERQRGGSIVSASERPLDAALVAGCIVGLVALMPILGGLLAMIVFMLVLLSLFNRGRWVTNTLYSLALPLGLWGLFAGLLNASMPRGILGF